MERWKGKGVEKFLGGREGGYKSSSRGLKVMSFCYPRECMRLTQQGKQVTCLQ